MVTLGEQPIFNRSVPFEPLARLSLYLTDGNTLDDSLGAPKLPIPLQIHIVKSKQARNLENTVTEQGGSLARESPRHLQKKKTQGNPPTVWLSSTGRQHIFVQGFGVDAHRSTTESGEGGRDHGLTTRNG